MNTSVQFTEPVVKQITVTIKNVIIGKRQLTQRVFKQILERDIFGEEANTLNGEAWGFVNYFWKGCTGYGRKHILWVTPDGQLRRYLLTNSFKYWKGHVHEQAARYLLSEMTQLYIAI